VPIVVPDGQGRYDWARLVVERTVSVNTAAAGGNAALLSLSEDAA
jgi:RHH-type proline utilization regulon transcriptional repressor/proline dehydrogenase/delta 1-pyrroline-5-carboxylate dehydrogenase